MEVVRVVTNESDAFVQAMLAEDGTDEAVVEKRKALFEQAPKVHVASLMCRWLGAESVSAVICSVIQLLLGILPFPS